MIMKPEDRGEIVRVATEAFNGKLLHFFFCLGSFDGLSISEFPDNETYLACVMSIVGEGRLAAVHSTTLLTPEEGQRAMQKAYNTIAAPSTESRSAPAE